MQMFAVVLRTLALIVALGIILPAKAEQKRDIQGVVLGSTWEGMRGSLPDLKCDVTGCDVSAGHLKIAVIGKPEARIYQIEFTFKSGLLPPLMIEEISRQYALRPEKVNQRDIDYAMSERREFDPDLGRMTTHVGGPVAHWKGPLGLEMNLSVNKPSRGASEYIFSLMDTALVKASQIADQKVRSDLEAAQRKTNRTPKF
jgi:hypothetical protein